MFSVGYRAQGARDALWPDTKAAREAMGPRCCPGFRAASGLFRDAVAVVFGYTCGIIREVEWT